MWQDFLTNDQLPIHKWTHYLPVYEEIFYRYKNRTCTVLEIGCSKGGSLQLWKRYLGPYALIIGIDIDPTCKAVEEDQIKVEIGSQSDREFLNHVTSSHGPFDIIIDDGSHLAADIQLSFQTLFTSLTPDGVYIVEDLHAAYWSEYGGGLGQPISFIEFTKTVIDAMHCSYIRDDVLFDDFVLSVANATRSIVIVDSLIAYQKGRSLRKHAPLIGKEKPISNLISELTF